MFMFSWFDDGNSCVKHFSCLKFSTLFPFDMDDVENGCHGRFGSLDSESADVVDSAQVFVNSNCELACVQEGDCKPK